LIKIKLLPQNRESSMRYSHLVREENLWGKTMAGFVFMVRLNF